MVANNCANNCASNLASGLAGGSVPTYQQNWGSALKALWDVRSGAISGGNWTDQIAARVGTAFGAPALAVDTVNFRGIPCYRYLGAESHGTTSIGVPIIAAGSPFYVWMVGRVTVSPSGLMFVGWNNGFNEAYKLSTPANSQLVFNGGAVGAGVAAQANGQLFELYTDAAGTVVSAINGVTNGTFGTGQTLPFDIERINIGGTGGAFGQGFIAQHGLVNVSPTPTQLIQQRARILQDWNI